MGTRTPKWDKNENKVGRRTGNKNPKVGQEWEQSGNKVEEEPKLGQEWNKVGTKWEEEP